MSEKQQPERDATLEDLPERVEPVAPSDATDTKGGISAYIGETEKHIDAVFRAAKPADVTLRFDEGDSLFKR